MTEVNPTHAIVIQIAKARWLHVLRSTGSQPSKLFLGKSDYAQLEAACPVIQFQFNGKVYDGLEVHRTELENELRVE